MFFFHAARFRHCKPSPNSGKVSASPTDEGKNVYTCRAIIFSVILSRTFLTDFFPSSRVSLPCPTSLPSSRALLSCPTFFRHPEPYSFTLLPKDPGAQAPHSKRNLTSKSAGLNALRSLVSKSSGLARDDESDEVEGLSKKFIFCNTFWNTIQKILRHFFPHPHLFSDCTFNPQFTNYPSSENLSA